ncbi:MAG: hypothetical protein ACRCYX_09030 [Dermatophilaceae bacterium]
MTHSWASGLPSHSTDGSLTEAPETGDQAVDTALAAMTAAPDDLDAQLQAGEEVHRALQSRLSDLGG